MAALEKKCSFCGLGSDQAYGKFFSSDEFNLYVHQYCMFFASGLAQNGGDNEGFDGFLQKDILKEISRGRRLKCSFCRKNGATVGCTVNNCKIKYHYPCGQKNQTLEQFYGNFHAFCKKHKPVQVHATEAWKNAHCAICLDVLEDENENRDFLKMPCCTENYMHKCCLQRHASSSGYFCACPTCKNGERFQREMQTYGIYIPERDALWEEGDAFADLLEVYRRCDCRYCYCPGGRDFIANAGHWKLYRCNLCGHAASHRKCALAEGKLLPVFQCDSCIDVETRIKFDGRIKKETKSCAVLLTDINVSRKELPVASTRARYDLVEQGVICSMSKLSCGNAINANRGVQETESTLAGNVSRISGSVDKNSNRERLPLPSMGWSKNIVQLKCALYKYLEATLQSN